MRSGRGFSLIEVMVAAAILGIAATALFGLFSRSLFNLRRIQDVSEYQAAAQNVMNRVLLVPALPREARIQGRIDDLEANWTVIVSPWIPRTLDATIVRAVMKVDVELSWTGRDSLRSVKLETLKAGPLAASSFDFQRAVEAVFQN